MNFKACSYYTEHTEEIPQSIWNTIYVSDTAHPVFAGFSEL